MYLFFANSDILLYSSPMQNLKWFLFEECAFSFLLYDAMLEEKKLNLKCPGKS